MWISCWWQGAGLTALETEILYLSTGQVQHRQRQCELSPHHPVHVPQPWPGGTTSRGERGCSVSKAHSILPPQPRLPTRGGPVALVIFVLWTPPVHGDLDWPPHLISHRLRSPPDGNTNSLFFFPLFFFFFCSTPFPCLLFLLPHFHLPTPTWVHFWGYWPLWCEKLHILLTSCSFLPFLILLVPHPIALKTQLPFWEVMVWGEEGVGGAASAFYGGEVGESRT